jgi:hypothetical protein
VVHPSRRDVAQWLFALSGSCALNLSWGSARSDTAFRRGINVWPWFALTREFPPPSRGFGWPPFESGRPRPSARDLAALRASGFDFVRLPVDPGPLLAFRGQERDQLMAIIGRAIDSILAADLSIILDLHPNEATHFWNGRQVLDEGPDGSFDRFVDLITEMARLLKRAPRHRAALELVNEPPLPCGSPNWQRQQVRLLAAARGISPDMAVILTGACGSLPEGLLALVPPDPLDRNIFYTFHYYEPYLFSHQGAVWMTQEPLYKYLRNVPWPAAAGSLEATRASVRAQIAADTILSVTDRSDIIATAERVLVEYFDADPDKWHVEKNLSRVTEWREQHHIDARQVLLGEFGSTKYAHPSDRARYLRDVRTTAEAHGFAWAFWNLFDTMGLTLDDRSHILDGSLIMALGLRTPD